jgi:hypothetical protein
MPATSLPTTPDQASDRHGHSFGIYLAFVPWIAFSLIEQHSTLKAAAVVALICSTAIALPSIIAHRPKLLELGAILAFAGFTLVAFNADPAAGHLVARYARAIAATLLALIAFSSLLLTPFTEQYARETVPRQFWSSPRFKEVNRRLTLMWALVFCAMVPAHMIAGAIDTHSTNLIFNWGVPIILIMWAVRRTGELSAPEGEKAPAHS